MNRRESLQHLAALGLLPLMPSSLLNSDKIATRPIPKTGEQLPVVGVGTWETFDVDKNAQDLQLLRELLKVLTDKGGKVADSSPMYGFAEKTLGDLSTELDLNNKMFLAT